MKPSKIATYAMGVLAFAALMFAILEVFGPEGGVVATVLGVLAGGAARRKRRDPSRDQAQAETDEINDGQEDALDEASEASDAGETSAAAVDGIPVPPPTDDAIVAQLKRSRGE